MESFTNWLLKELDERGWSRSEAARRGGISASMFVKLPDWFVVPTPIGDYNPDWAVVFHVQDGFGETREKLYLVRETKGSVDVEELRAPEQMKIDCARRHFEAIEVDYDIIASAQEFRERVLAEQQ